MNLTALRDRCEQRFRDPTNQIVTEAQWLLYLNEAYRDVISASPFWPFKEVASTGTLTVTAGATYVNLPTDAERVTSVRNATDDVVLQQVDGNAVPAANWANSDETGVPGWYRVYAGRLYVYPTPASDTVLDVEYPSPPADLSAGSDEPDFPENHHTVLIEGALKRAYEDDGDFARADRCKLAFDEALAAMKVDLLAPARHDHYPGIADDWWE